MTTRQIPLFFLLCLTLIFSACAGSLNQQPALESTSWMLTSLNGEPVLPSTNPTLSFANGQVSGNGSCNSFGGEYTTKGDKLTFGALSSTLMACAEPGRMEQENAFFSALSSVAAYRLEGAKLIFYTAEGVSLAEFYQTSP